MESLAQGLRDGARARLLLVNPSRIISICCPKSACQLRPNKSMQAAALKSMIRAHVAATASPASVDAPHNLQASRRRRPENVEGEFYVDHTCIDCDACRWIAPDNFSRVGCMSAVAKQPRDEEERTAMLQALLSCPTKSIHTSRPPLQQNVKGLFPLAIHDLPGVYHCGYHSQKSDGATPFLITSPGGNILVDSPRYTDNLAHHIDKLGGVRYMFLTHLHDIADHARWQRRFTCDRVMHMGDIKPDTFHVEMILDGSGPWSLGPDIDLIYTPGHTAGSVCLLHKSLKALFSGDHIGLSPTGELTIWPHYCQHSVERQLESLRDLLPMDFVWIFPGHLRRIKFNDVKQKNAALLKLMEEEISTQKLSKLSRRELGNSACACS